MNSPPPAVKSSRTRLSNLTSVFVVLHQRANAARVGTLVRKCGGFNIEEYILARRGLDLFKTRENGCV